MIGVAARDTTPELDLWLTFARRAGAIHDTDGDGGFLVVLPVALQRAFDLSEELEVTASPDAARDTGATLLCAGHPLADAVASTVLTEGDAGERWVAWPAGVPRADQLLESARAFLPVDHGRVDAGDPPRALYAPLLRVGALVTYTIDQRYQEREEIWVDGRSGAPVGRIDEALFVPRQVAARTVAAPDVVRALDGADAMLSRRAERRLHVLQTASAAALAEETDRAIAYYRDALHSLERRRHTAAPERQAMYTARIEATARERDRRVQEVGEKFQPRRESRPFRLHLVHCPALDVPLIVRRGERAYPLTLTWLVPHSAFVAVRCPGCGAEEPLVAGRSHLGCRSCLARPAAPAEPEIAVQGTRVALKAQAAPPVDRAAAPPPPRAATRPREAEGIQRRLEAQRRKRDAAAIRAQQTRSSGRHEHVGDRLSFDLWRASAMRKRLPERQVVPDSPFAVLQRLFGTLAAQVALGIPVAAIPDSSTSATTSLGPETGFTWGTVRTGGGSEYRYLLRWRALRNRALASELYPSSQRLSFWDPTGDPSLAPWTVPTLEALLWSTDIARIGVPAVARCIAMWSAMRPMLEHIEPATAAAALATFVARRWQVRRPAAQMSRDYGASPQAVTRAVRLLTNRLQ